MAEGKKSFTAYCDWGEVLDKLTDEQAGKLMKHLFDYVRDKNPVADDVLTDIAFTSIKSTLKRDLIKWEQKCQTNKENGKKGGRPKNPNKPNGYLENRSKPKKPDSDSVSVSDIDSVKVSDKVKKNIEYRKHEFKNSLTPFLESFGKDLLNEFFGYWSEHGINDRKMRFEKEKSFGLSRRLATWKKNQLRFQKEEAKNPGANAMDLLMNKHNIKI